MGSDGLKAESEVHSQATQPLRHVTLRIKRSDPANGIKPHWQEFNVDCPPETSILEVVLRIIDEQDGSVAIRYNCRGGVCGSCAVLINSKYHLACRTLVKDFAKGKTIHLEPLPHFPVIRDLACDVTIFISQLTSVKPFQIAELSGDLSVENLQSPRDHRKITQSAVDCILCGCCHSSCPMVWTNPYFVGPIALAKAHRFNVDSRESREGKDARLQIVDSENGLWRCHTSLNCTEVCPKNIQITSAIQGLKRMAFRRKLRRIFRRS
ncbi:MAG: succinate dehydrogenase/fumarate reductase iron-sulfur subunit [Candidatus Heimdallarchaeota archaeon]